MNARHFEWSFLFAVSLAPQAKRIQTEHTAAAERTPRDRFAQRRRVLEAMAGAGRGDDDIVVAGQVVDDEPHVVGASIEAHRRSRAFAGDAGKERRDVVAV